MDWDLIKMIVVIVLIVAVCLVGTLGLLIPLDIAGCNAQTADIGYDHRWSFWGGCQIEVKEGRWIPLDSYYFKEE